MMAQLSGKESERFAELDKRNVKRCSLTSVRRKDMGRNKTLVALVSAAFMIGVSDSALAQDSKPAI